MNILPWPEETLNKHIIYLVTNTKTNKIYIGKHLVNRLNDTYFGSGIGINLAIDKHGLEVFTREVLEIYDTEDEAEAREEEIVNDEFIRRIDTYNRVRGGGLIHNTPETNAKRLISLAKTRDERGYVRNTPILSIEGIIYHHFNHVSRKYNIGERILRRRLGNPDYPDWFHLDQDKQKYYEDWFIETQKNIKAHRKASSERLKATKGIAKSQETRDKMSKARTGIPKTKEQVDKVNKNPEKIRKTAEKHRGMKRSPEAKLKMGAARRAFFHRNGGPQNSTYFTFHNPVTGEETKVHKTDVETPPEGFIRGCLPIC